MGKSVLFGRQFRKKQRESSKKTQEKSRSSSKSSTNTGPATSSSSQQSSSKPPPPPPPRPARPTSREAYLELLGFAPDADPGAEELKKAYRKMAMQWHPDRPHNRERSAEATEMFQAAKEAYDYFMEEHWPRR